MGMEDDIHLRLARPLSLASLKVQTRGGVRIQTWLRASELPLLPGGNHWHLLVYLDAVLLHLALLFASCVHL